MDKLQEMMESNQHLKDKEAAYDLTLEVSKFWSILGEEDKDYIQMCQMAIEEEKEWNV
jgi:hypothetical protein